MINALLLSLGQMSDRRIAMMMMKVILITILLLITLGAGAYFSLVWLISLAGWNDGGLAAATAAALIAIFAAIFLFRVVAMFVLNIFSDEVIDAVEARHYPARAVQAQPPGYAIGFRMGLASAGRAIGYNILAAPVYILLLVTGIGTPVAFFAVNAVLIGRDLQDMVAARHVKDQNQMQAEIDNEWRLPKATRFGLGLLTALLLAIPFVNFLAPILGAAMATHLVHMKREEMPQS